MLKVSRSTYYYQTENREKLKTDINLVWVSDITYIRIELGFVYLAVILDAFSYRVIGSSQEA